MHPSLPPRPSFLPPPQPTLENSQNNHYFTNTSGYRPQGYHLAPIGASNVVSTVQPPPALVNPYAPHINYSLLPLPPVNSSTTIRGHGYSPGNQQSSTHLATSLVCFQHGLGPPPQLNGAGTSGPAGCTQIGCFFRGTRRDVHIHMMDRHLIFPPGWKEKKRKRDEDSDYLADEEAEARLKG
jgi:hypothetical protein